ncbi:hypothetical protein PGTUg99_015102 [Puccinia graminis f. sp. tritici]|uniref:Uncharacterized protein n=1 Tax=Puccinia graminis f. sp. tritici TaxID=56615 RepID=A0A5B0MRV4_PUCGR|nr:hypothetical protein PGTUg99_015102 [Puccinia graminis f. sp. tritici]
MQVIAQRELPGFTLKTFSNIPCQSTGVFASLTFAFSSLSTPNQYSAYRKILYDGDSTLDQNESSAERTSGSCVTNIKNPKFMNVPKAIIENAFDQILARCNSRSGSAALPGFDGVRLSTRHHRHPSASSWEDDMELNRVFCSNGPKGIKIVKQDCVEAYRLIPTNDSGRFVPVYGHLMDQRLRRLSLILKFYFKR